MKKKEIFIVKMRAVQEQLVFNNLKIVQKFSEPKWMNKEGEIVDDKMDNFGYKVQLELHRPDMCIVFDEVGCNLSQ